MTSHYTLLLGMDLVIDNGKCNMANNSSAFAPATFRKNRGDAQRIQPPAVVEETLPEKFKETTDLVTDSTTVAKAEVAVPEAEAPKVKAEVARPAVMVSAVDPITAQIAACLTEYKTLLSGTRISKNQSAQAMAFLKKATDLIVQNPTTANLSALWTFHQQNRSGVCAERTALTGINQLDPKSQQIVTTVYNAFRSKVMQYPTPMQDREILSVVPCQKLIQFLKTAR